MDIDEYATTNARKGGTPCGVCNLPIELRVTVEDAANRYSYPTIARWLTEDQGYDGITKYTVGNHMREHTSR